jgi:hypothetical protein
MNFDYNKVKNKKANKNFSRNTWGSNENGKSGKQYGGEG